MNTEKNNSGPGAATLSVDFDYAFKKYSPPALKPLHYKEVFQTTRHHRLQLIKNGVIAPVITQLAKAMSISQDRLIASLGLPRTTILRKIQHRQLLSVVQAERVIGLAKLIGQIEIMLSASEASGFDAAQWLGGWLYHPVPALGNHLPEAFMDTIIGQEIVSALLFQMQSGAYA